LQDVPEKDPGRRRGPGSKRSTFAAHSVPHMTTQHASLQVLYKTGATGLEPATSGVTGRSWCFRVDRESAGITVMRRSFRTSSCGDYRVQAGASADILRDLRGMGCWRTWQRGDERGPRFALLGRGLRARCYGCVRMTFARGSNHRDLRRDRAGTTSTGTIGCDPELPARAGISSPSELACDQLRPATARQSLCRTRVVGLVSHQPTRLVPGG
jgi:hypothetical protein